MARSDASKNINPTDKLRKKQRQTQLKKNRKQRQTAREEIIKGKDPEKIVEEILRSNQQEIACIDDGLMNDRVYDEKKRKLRATLEKIILYYQKIDPQKYAELRQLQAECALKCKEAWNEYYEKVQDQQESIKKNKFSQSQIQLPAEVLSLSGQITLADIPLPDGSAASSSSSEPYKTLLNVTTKDISYLSENDYEKTDDIQAKASQSHFESNQAFAGLAPIPILSNQYARKPGPPPGPIPVDALRISEISVPQPQNNLPMHFVSSDSHHKSLPMTHSFPKGSQNNESAFPSNQPFNSSISQSFSMVNAMQPHTTLYLPPSQNSLSFGHGFHVLTQLPPESYSTSLSSEPTISQQTKPTDVDSHGKPESVFNPVISAKPQLKNVTAEVTKLVPTSVRIKRDQTTLKTSDSRNEKQISKPGSLINSTAGSGFIPSSVSRSQLNKNNPNKPSKTKDEVYDEFMKEMQGLL